MKKVFVFFAYISIVSTTFLSVTTHGQATTTQDIGLTFIGIPGTTTPQALDLNGPRGIKEIKEKVYYYVSPEKPRMGDLVEIRAEMYGTPVKNAEFAWVINGKTYSRGVGLNKVSFLVSEPTSVTLVLLTGEGNIVTKQWSFDPQNTLIVWEAGTYTPPFYKGKSLYTAESSLALHAINLDVENPLTNVYANYVWQVDGRVKGDDSGVGKSTYVYQGDLLGLEPLFTVDFSGVSSFADGLKAQQSTRKTINGSAKLRVQTKQSQIFTYEKTPLLGVLFNKPLVTNYTLTTPETTVVSYPGYYSLNSALAGDYIWTINDTIVSRGANSLTFKKIRSDEKSRLGVEIKNKKSLLQSKNISYIIDTSSKQSASTSTSSGFGK